MILVVCVFILNGKPKTEIPDGMPNARFSTKDEIRAGNREARRQIAKGELTETAFELNPETGITFAFSNPGGVFPGLSGTGKSKNFIIPTLRSAIKQKHSIFVTDVEGELIKATAAYAHANGYKGRIYAYAPGVQSLSPLGKLVQFGGSFNFLEVMRHPNDKAKAQEISRGLNVNTQEDTQKRHAYFGPQSDALMETALMLAKGSRYPDMLMVWAIITLPDLAERLDIAAKTGRLGKELSFYAKQSSAGLRAVASQGKGKGDSPSASIQSSAFNMFSKFIDPEVAKAFLPSTIPLEHSGPSIVYCRLDRTQLKATSPLVATALHLWLNYNLDPQRNRDRNLTLISDEANFFILPDLSALAKLARKKGGTFWLAYQQNSAMEEAYGKAQWKGIEANLKNKAYFNTGEHDYHKIVSESLGKKTIVINTANSSHSSNNRTTGSSDQLKEVPLVPAEKLDEQKLAGRCVISSASYPHPISFLDKPIPYDPNSKTAKMEKQCVKAWEEKLLPALQEEHASNQTSFTDPETGKVTTVTIEDEIALRERVANSLLPHPDVVRARELAAKKAKEKAEKEAQAQAQGDDKPVTVLPL
ncbi:hypothetical protein AM10699_56860 (plasmid) [Acaryochloris marina MBIC10699]|nr:hypothetical protein AM10699_56860 [Acaryochloris marina MBIC10699]